MDIEYRALQEPKPGANADQCEDALAYSDDRWLAAVCDGASNAFESRLWARLLAQGFVADPPLGLGDDALRSWADSMASRWSQAIPWQALTVFQEAKAREGSASTLVGLELEPSPQQPDTGRWRCLALGDSCLFQVSDGRLAEKLPVTRSADFSLRTPLLYTERNSNRHSVLDAVRSDGNWQQGDCFFLLTDAIAQWFLREDEQGAAPWTTLMSLDEASFPAFVKEMQARHQMRQDDATALILGMGVPLATRRTPSPAPVQAPRATEIERADASKTVGVPWTVGAPSQWVSAQVQPAQVPPAQVPPTQVPPAGWHRSIGVGTPDSMTGTGDRELASSPHRTRGRNGAGVANPGTERHGTTQYRRRRSAVVFASVLILVLAIVIPLFALSGPAPAPATPTVPAVQPAAGNLADLLTTYPGGGAAAYQTYEDKLSSYVLNRSSVVVAQLAGSGSAPPSSFTSQTRGVTVAVVHSTGSEAELYLIVGQAVTVPYSSQEPYTCRTKTDPASHTCFAKHSGIKDVSRQLLVHLTMTRRGQQWLANGAQVQLVAGQVTGALILPVSTS